MVYSRAIAIASIFAISTLTSAIPLQGIARDTTKAPGGTPWVQGPQCFAAYDPSNDFDVVLQALRNPPDDFDSPSYCSQGLQQSLVAWEIDSTHLPTTTTIIVRRTSTKTVHTSRPTHYGNLDRRQPMPLPTPKAVLQNAYGLREVKRDFVTLPPFLDAFNNRIYVDNWLAGACSCVITAALADSTYTTHTRTDEFYDLTTATVRKTSVKVVTTSVA